MSSVESLIASIDYDEGRAKLWIRFENGEEFIFVGVPASVHCALCEAPSLGQYVGERIMNTYPYNVIQTH